MAMKFEKLSIKQLSNTGELINVINCYAGQVSVFRATSSTALGPFQRALAGIPGAERFSITVDDLPYRPEDHNLVGFGERFSPEEGALSVTEFLLKAGVSESQLQNILVSYGLDHIADRKCSELPPCEERRTRLIAASYNTDKVLIANDPLHPIASHWRERFAELLTSYARHSQQIVLVPSLSYRPDSWIDNDLIARIQVGDAIQKTIGYGTAPSGAHDMISQLREEFGSKPGVEASHASMAVAGSAVASGAIGALAKDTVDSDFPDSHSSSLGKATQNPIAIKGITLGIVGAAAVATVIAGVMIGDSFRSKSSEPTEVAIARTGATENKENPAQTEIEDPHSDVSGIVPVGDTTTSAATKDNNDSAKPADPANNPPPPPEFIVDLYPADIKNSILESFEGALTTTVSAVMGEDKSPRLSEEQSGGRDANLKIASRSEKTRAAADLLDSLQSTSGSGDGLKDSPQNNNSYSNYSREELVGMSPEQRREVIRQKFLEAIQRAAQNRG